MAHYHYLDYTPLSGHRVRYTVRAGDQRDALLSFRVNAWKLSDRDRLLGWTPGQCQRHLHLIINNTRFVILSWVEVKSLASRILAHAVTNAG